MRDNLIVYDSDVYVSWKILTAHLLDVESDALITCDSLVNYVYNNYNLHKIIKQMPVCAKNISGDLHSLSH